MPVISDLALYEVTVRRIDQCTGEEWTYPRLVSRASSVRGALTDALIAPLDRWHHLPLDAGGTDA